MPPLCASHADGMATRVPLSEPRNLRRIGAFGAFRAVLDCAGSTAEIFRACCEKTRSADQRSAAICASTPDHDAVAARLVEPEDIGSRRPGPRDQVAANGGARARQPCLDHVFGHVQRRRHFGGAHAFDFAQHEHFARAVCQPIDRRLEHHAQLTGRGLTLRVWGCRATHEGLHIHCVLVDTLVVSLAAYARQGFVDRQFASAMSRTARAH